MKIIDRINEKWGVIVSLLVLVMTLVITIEVVGRGTFGRPTLWAHEATQLTFGIYVLFAGAYAHYCRAHVAIDVSYKALPAKGRMIIDWLSFVLFCLFCAVLIWQGSVLAWQSIAVREVSTSPLAPPLYPFKALIPIGVLLMFLQGISNLMRQRQSWPIFNSRKR